MHLAVAKRVPCYECVYLLLKHHATSLVFNNNLQSPLSILYSLSSSNASLEKPLVAHSSATITSAIDQQRSQLVKPVNNSNQNQKRKTNQTISTSTAGVPSTLTGAANNNPNTGITNWNGSISSVHSRIISDLFKSLDIICQHFQLVASSVTTTATAVNLNTDSLQKNKNISKSNESNENEITDSSKHVNLTSSAANHSRSEKQRNFFKKSNTQVQKRQNNNANNAVFSKLPAINSINHSISPEKDKDILGRLKKQGTFQSSLKKKRQSLSNPVSIAATAISSIDFKITMDPHSQQQQQMQQKRINEKDMVRKRALSHSSSETNHTEIASLSDSIKRAKDNSQRNKSTDSNDHTIFKSSKVINHIIFFYQALKYSKSIS